MRAGDRVAIGAALGYLAVLAAKAVLAGVAVRRRRTRLSEADAAGPASLDEHGLTVLQPILSGDPQLESSLEATLLACPGARILWLVDTDDAEGRRVAETLAAGHPQCEIEIVDCPPCPPGASPKAFKLAFAEPRIEREAFAVIDDDTRVSTAGVAALLDGLRIAEVSTGLPSYEAGPGGWSRLLAEFVNDQAVLTYLPTAAFGSARALNGMTWAMRRSTLDRLGGFGPLVGLLADDLAIARLVRDSGGRIDQTEVPQTISTTVPDGRRYRAMMHRWMMFATLALRAERPGPRAALVAAYALPSMLLATLVGLWVARPSAAKLGAVAAALALRSGVIVAAQRAIHGRARHAPLRSLLAELAMPVQFAVALVDRRIAWRSSRYLVRANDRFEEVGS
ncbi:glycosyltransferase [Agromyces sp. NPDC058136]|uniref:glycosyltransferase n=1 Tax=Agromyces sp. NPDC058136 TaxID=3346354 RepID=UPI0036D81C19